ncbi:MAG: hypothetical protein ABJF50_14365 [Paracoccaceae bacterium]
MRTIEARITSIAIGDVPPRREPDAISDDIFWYAKEIIKGRKVTFTDGKFPVPSCPGLGIELDPEAVAELYALYNPHMIVDRDDTDEMLKYIPDHVRKVPRR